MPMIANMNMINSSRLPRLLIEVRPSSRVERMICNVFVLLSARKSLASLKERIIVDWTAKFPRL
jgi:hypothetical protein